MRLTAQADYAVVMMAAAARHVAAGYADARRMTAGALADDIGLPLPTVQKLVSRMAAAGLIESARGHAGGFRLARPPREISVADIVEAIEGPIALTTCVDEGRHDCLVEHACRVRPHWQPVNAAVRAALASVTLDALAGEAAAPPVFTAPARAAATMLAGA